MARILLTGCCGYLGSWIARRLVEDGHQVRGTTQDPDYARTVLGELDVEVVRAELLEPESWRGLAEDCEVVVHTACPVVTEVGVPQEAMIDPALVGTETVLREAARAGTVRRVVHLSSIVTLLDHHRPAERGTGAETVGPHDWNETASPETDPYAYAKVRGERLARRLVSEWMPQATFASVLPGPVIGPPLGGRVAGSIEKTLEPLLSGQLRFGSVELYLGLVDVRDVAAVVARLVMAPAVTLEGIAGRFICTAQPVTSMQALADALRRGYPDLAPVLPRRTLPLPRGLLLLAMRPRLTPEAASYMRAMLGRRVDYDTSLAEDLLGVRWRPLDVSVCDTVAWLRDRGFRTTRP